MAYKVKKPCRVCGKMYVPCADCENDNTVFHWRTVACSYECGKKYFEKVLEERNKSTKKSTKMKSVSSAKKSVQTKKISEKVENSTDKKDEKISD